VAALEGEHPADHVLAHRAGADELEEFGGVEDGAQLGALARVERRTASWKRSIW
jgi:hypothetical protein